MKECSVCRVLTGACLLQLALGALRGSAPSVEQRIVHEWLEYSRLARQTKQVCACLRRELALRSREWVCVRSCCFLWRVGIVK